MHRNVDATNSTAQPPIRNSSDTANAHGRAQPITTTITTITIFTNIINTDILLPVHPRTLVHRHSIMSTELRLYDLTLEEKQRSSQLESLLPDLEADVA